VTFAADEPRALDIAFVTHYYPPEVGAPQTRLSATARLLESFGHRVRIVTGPPHYPDGVVRPGYRALQVRREQLDGIEVLRLPVVVRPNRGFLDRVIDGGSFAAAATAALPVIRRSDVFLVDSPPLFLGFSARILRALARRPYVFHVADPWPDFPIAMGALRGRLPIRAARLLESVSYRGASVITTVSPGLVARLDANPAAGGRVRLLANGVDLERFDPTADGGSSRRMLGWPDARLSLAYVGTIGLAQGVGTLISAMEVLRDEDVTLHLYGEGAERAELSARAVRAGLDRVIFHEAVTIDRVPRVLAAADASVVLLKQGPLYEESLPTKLVEGLAAGRPVIVSAAGDSARIVLDGGAGYAAAPGDVDALVGAIRACLADPDRRPMGLAARRVAEEGFDRVALARQLERYLLEAVGRPVPAPGPAAERGSARGR
jgi:colanic acid biosynthesis glycosyl transferase WcaI